MTEEVTADNAEEKEDIEEANISESELNSNSIIDFIIVLLIILDIFLLLIADFANLSLDIVEKISYFDLIVCFVLFCELLVRFKRAEDKKLFFKDKFVWLDIIAMIPLNFFAFRMFRFVRLAKVFKVLSVLKLVGLSRKSFDSFNKFIKESHLDWSLGILIFAICVGTILYYFVEFGTKGNISGIFDSLSYVTLNIITAGSDTVSPHTLYGRIIGIGLMLTGAIFFGMFTASLASWLVTKSEKKEKDEKTSEIKELKELITNMQSEIKELKDLIKKSK
ncbi:potassium channel family protein [Methanobacterium sp. ACI-7]|uniref:potassium channel family protein n=1 Tax=unclassified Methanobacterium TaxID=2627676 RepID=UPI0039C2DB22